MTKFRNMKIEINNQQPLDEMVRELERLGYSPYQPSPHNECVYAWDDGLFCVDKNMETMGVLYSNTTLSDLKKMEWEMKSFDEWYAESDHYYKYDACKDAWSHQQQKIDELQKRIDDALYALESDAIGFSGLVHNYNKAEKILKGETHEY